MDIDDLDFEYQTKERKEAINEFIKKSKAEYDEFFQQLLKDDIIHNIIEQFVTVCRFSAKQQLSVCHSADCGRQGETL